MESLTSLRRFRRPALGAIVLLTVASSALWAVGTVAASSGSHALPVTGTKNVPAPNELVPVSECSTDSTTVVVSGPITDEPNAGEPIAVMPVPEGTPGTSGAPGDDPLPSPASQGTQALRQASAPARSRTTPAPAPRSPNPY